MDICRAFINDEDDEYDEYSILSFKSENTKINIPIYKFIRKIEFAEILKYIKTNYGIQCNLYKLIKQDDRDFKMNMGVSIDVSDFKGEISIENIESYVSNYMKRDYVYSNQYNTVRKYILHKLLSENLDLIVREVDVCKKYYKEICICITNLSEKFILDNISDIKKIIKNISKDRWDESNIRRLLCFLDKVVYRQEVVD